MPPSVPRKRHRSSTPTTDWPPSKRAASAKETAKPKLHTRITRAKPSVFDTLDAPPRPTASRPSILNVTDSSSDDGELSSVDSDDFEDVPMEKGGSKDHTYGEEDMEWEEVLAPEQTSSKPDDRSLTNKHLPKSLASSTIQDVSITFDQFGDAVSFDTTAMDAAGRKGPTKIERHIRIQTHCMHVQYLMFHNLVRNSWIEDREVHKILVDSLGDGMRKELSRWRRAMGMADATKGANEGQSKSSGSNPGASNGTSTKSKGKGNLTKAQKEKVNRERIRDWGADASKAAPGQVDLSHGDPLLRFLQVLAAYWKKRFKITRPGLRKQGYRSIGELDEEVKAAQLGPHDPEMHGELINNIGAFRELAKKCEGSRDVGAQLFTALLRGLGLEARMVASLQPLGFGWSKAEDAAPRKKKSAVKNLANDVKEGTETLPDDDDTGSASTKQNPVKSLSKQNPQNGTRRSTRARGSSSDLSDPPSSSDSDSDSDLSIVDITPVKPASAQKSYDRDVPYPIYWTEVLSSVTNTYIAVSAITTSTKPSIPAPPIVASQADQFQAFSPTGKAAEKGKQVISYAVAFSPDGTAKDVTVRYLKKRQLPGKTKGVRLPVEKIPIYNKHGKVRRYEEFDWFKSVLRGYARQTEKRTLADDIEDEGDLVPFKPSKGEEKTRVKEESLAGYKASADFVLERHLRREEALLPTAKPVKEFTVGKGDKATTEDVYRRKDVVTCKTVESWHKEGRRVKAGEQPLKHVPIRAVTLIRKREIEESTRAANGEKPTQGLYSKDQTEWIIPDPIKDGKIPRNTFGNIDVYVPSMVPKGAIHVPLRGTAKLCKKLGFDFAEACTGFEFGKQRAVPVLTGVVVALGNEHALIDAWEAEQKEKARKEYEKREKATIARWKKFIVGVRIMDRMKRQWA
ncbi:Rad4-domain-containing protein, partial [Aulographum hederae CBS 113979]